MDSAYAEDTGGDGDAKPCSRGWLIALGVLVAVVALFLVAWAWWGPVPGSTAEHHHHYHRAEPEPTEEQQQHQQQRVERPRSFHRSRRDESDEDESEDSAAFSEEEEAEAAADDGHAEALLDLHSVVRNDAAAVDMFFGTLGWDAATRADAKQDARSRFAKAFPGLLESAETEGTVVFTPLVFDPRLFAQSKGVAADGGFALVFRKAWTRFRAGDVLMSGWTVAKDGTVLQYESLGPFRVSDASWPLVRRLTASGAEVRGRVDLAPERNSLSGRVSVRYAVGSAW